MDLQTNGTGVPTDPRTVTAADGSILFLHHWGSPKPGGRTLFITHGLGEHGGRYAHLYAALGDVFDEIYALDLRGHGRSQGIRGYAASFDQLVDDARGVLKGLQSAASAKGRKFYFLGHSMGGLLALRLLQREKAPGLAGAFISAPFLGLASTPPPWKMLMGKALNATLAGLQLHNDINPSHLSHDPAVVEAYVNDRLVHAKITPRLYFTMAEVQAAVRGTEAPLPCPSLFIIPLEDKIVDHGASQTFFARLKDRNKALKEYAGFYHEALNETRNDQVFADMRDWVERNES